MYGLSDLLHYYYKLSDDHEVLRDLSLSLKNGELNLPLYVNLLEEIFLKFAQNMSKLIFIHKVKHLLIKLQLQGQSITSIYGRLYF